MNSEEERSPPKRPLLEGAGAVSVLDFGVIICNLFFCAFRFEILFLSLFPVLFC